MPQGKPGADSNDIVTAKYGGITLLDHAQNLFGQKPAFWGRYFKTFGNTDSAQYQPAQENAVLNAQGIPVMPIARQTPRVGGAASWGQADAQGNAEAVIQSFGATYLATLGIAEFYVFLDVEPTHPLSPDYYSGWAAELIAHGSTMSNGQYTLQPCVYVNVGDDTTFQAINAAAAHGAACKGVWIAHYPISHTNASCVPPMNWDPTKVTPNVAINCPILAWQYVGDCYGTPGVDGVFDGNQVNPNIDQDADFLDHLILPPPQ
jgi:hypothetical protein